MAKAEEPEADRKQWTLGQLLAWHMRFGTRPSGTPGKPGRRWKQIDLANACEASDRVVRAWLADEYPPEIVERVERAFFGDSKNYDLERAELRNAWAPRPR